MSQKKEYFVFVVSFIFLISYGVWAQGPKTSYYFNPATELSWASCYVYMDGGSQQKIQFMPLVNIKGAPCGTEKYSKDINVKGPIVFIGNGIYKKEVWDSYNKIDVSNKIVMFCHDFPDSINAQLEKEVSLEYRITEAVSRKASAVVLFSYKEEYPFLFYKDKNMENIPEIPIITITKNSAIDIFACAGRDAKEIFNKWKETGKPKSEKFISKMDLKIKGKFDKVVTPNFTFCFRKELIPEKEMKKIAEINEKSVIFLHDIFKPEQLSWKKTFTAYFRDFDSKLFYTHHWGRGLSCDAGVFIVHEGGIPNYGLAVHENTHTLININWGGTTSFMDEGIAKYAEAQAVDKDKNHLLTIQFLKEGELIPIKEMLTINIGSSEKTNVAYPASGSFTEFLIESYALKNLKEAFILERRRKEEKEKEDTWEKAFGKSIDELEKEWLYWLVKRYRVDEKYIHNFLKK
ncbi:hypothetical protein ACFL1R_11080 [Candidatus Latescibacterota bacterium]